MTGSRAPAARIDGAEDNPVPFRARIRPTEEGPAPLRIAGWLTPYEVETLAMDARRMGCGARLELTVGASASERRLEWVRRQFAGLGRRGIEVSVRRDGDGRPDASHVRGPAVHPRGQRGG